MIVSAIDSLQAPTCIREMNCLMSLSPNFIIDVKQSHIDSSTGIPDTKFYKLSGTKLSSSGLRKWLSMTVSSLAVASLDFLISFGRIRLFGLHIERSRPHCTFNASANRVWKRLLKTHFSAVDGCPVNFVVRIPNKFRTAINELWKLMYN